MLTRVPCPRTPKVRSGSHADFMIKHDRGRRGQQAITTLFEAYDDAICMAYATITWPGEQGHMGALLGDWGRFCAKFLPSKNGGWYCKSCATTYPPS